MTSEKPLGVALVVEDDEHMRALLVSMARQHGFQRVTEAATISEALERLEYEFVELALIDLGLAGDDGIKLIYALRAHAQKRVRSVTAVVVSKSATEARILETIKAGADGFIVKPITMASFHRQVSLALTRRVHARPMTPEAAPARETLQSGAANYFEVD